MSDRFNYQKFFGHYQNDIWWIDDRLRQIVCHTAASLDQVHYRFRNDDGSESAATWIDAEDTNIIVGSGGSVELDTNIRLRITVDDTASGIENNVNLQLQYNKNTLGWNSVNATSLNVRSSASGNFADDDNTTRQLTIPTGGSFITPNSGMDEDNGIAGETNDIDYVDGLHDFVEVEFCFIVRSTDVTNDDAIQFRVVRAPGGTLDAWSVTPQITVSQTAPLNITVSESMGFSDTLARQSDANRLISENLGLTDAFTVTAFAGGGTLEITIVELMGFDAVAPQKVNYHELVPDSLGFSDSAQRIAHGNRNLSDNLGQSDAVARQSDANRGITESLGLSEDLQRAADIFRNTIESLGFTDAASRISDANRLVSDNLGLTDAITVTGAGGGVLTIAVAESLGLSDALQRISDANRAISETLGISDLVARQADANRQVSDDLGLTESISVFVPAGGVILTIAVAENMGLSDALQRIADANRSLSDSFGASDTAQRAADAFRSISDDFGATDSVVRSATVYRLVSESLGLTDSASRSVLYSVLVAESLGLSDAIAATLFDTSGLAGPGCVTEVNLAAPSVSAVTLAVPSVSAVNLNAPSITNVHLEVCE